MTSNVVLAAVEGLAAQEIASLRFNFRGSGASEGTYDEGKGERDDVRAALSFAAGLDELDTSRTGLAGYSFGAGMSAAVASHELPALALIAMPLLLMVGDLDEYCEAGALEEFGTEIGPQVTTQVVEGADHFWGGFEGTIRNSVGEFFAAAL